MNMQQIMKQAQNLQKKMNDVQKILEEKTVLGSSGGGLIKTTMTCKNKLKKIEIDDSLLSQEEKEVLEDLIVAALNDAQQKAENATEEEMKNHGVSPDMLKMPF